MNARLVVLVLSTLLISGGVAAQSPTAPKQPAAEAPQLESRGESNAQQLNEWQRQRAEEYHRRLREYLATIGRMA